MGLATGCAQMDRMLGGGIPENRAVLVTGGPGVGKSTFAMQFLQEGLRADEQCLYISTEQTTAELHSSFAPFDFDLDHPNLEITSIHAMPDTTIEESQSGMALRTLQGDESIDGNFRYPFESEYIVEFLEQFAPCDRVVLDSASGLETISDNQRRFQRVVLELIRLFTDTFGATAIFTSEAMGPPVSDGVSPSQSTSQLLQFTTHGVIRLWWGQVEGSRRRFLEIVKMRGLDHDTRSYEVRFTDSGLQLVPSGRTSAAGIDPDTILKTGADGLDELSGGFVRGHSVLLETDGQAMVDHVVARIIDSAFGDGMAVWFFPSPIMGPKRLERLMPGDREVTDLLDRGQLSVLDGFGAWKNIYDHPGVYHAPSGIMGSLFRRNSTIRKFLMQKMAEEVDVRRGDRPHLGTVYTEAFLRWLDPEQVKEVYYWAREELAHELDTGFFIHNPATMEAQLAEFFHSDAVQVFETSMSEDGIQYLHLAKSPIGEPGETAVLNYTDDGLVVQKR